MKLNDVLKDFLLACEADGLSKSTRTWYQSLLGSFASHYEGKSLHDVTTQDVRRYIVGLRRQNYSESTISAHTRALHRLFAWVAAEYNTPNVMRNIHYPKSIQPTPRAINLDDLKAMIAAAGEGEAGLRNRAMLYLLIDTGCRAGGLVGLKIDDIDLKERRAFVTEKGGKTRGVIFTIYTAAVLTQWLEVRMPVAPLFYNLETLKPLTSNGLYQAMRRMARRAGVDGRFNPHSLRHAFAREYIRAGGDLATLSKLLGHRDVSTTVNHYIIFTQEELKEAHERYSPVGHLLEDDDSEESR